MKIALPENVCDSHVILGWDSQLGLAFTLSDFQRLMDKYHVQAAMVFSSEKDKERNSKELVLASRTDQKLYVLMRAETERYLNTNFIDYMETTIKNNERVVGVKLNSSLSKHRYTEPIYENLFQMLNENSAVLLLHCGRWVEMSGWKYALNVAEKYPHIKVIFAHMGGTHPDLSFEAIKATKNMSNVYFNTAQTRQPIVLKKAVQELGASRILFGSDTPWGNYVQNLVGITQLDLKERQLNDILRKNFWRLMH